MEGGDKPVFDEGAFQDPNENVPKPKFAREVLKLAVGDDKVNKVLNSLSMSIIPNVGGGSIGKDLFSSKCQKENENM